MQIVTVGAYTMQVNKICKMKILSINVITDQTTDSIRQLNKPRHANNKGLSRNKWRVFELNSPEVTRTESVTNSQTT